MRESRRDDRYRNVSAPRRGAFDADQADTVRARHVDRLSETAGAAIETGVCDLDTVGVDDADR